MQQSPPPLAFSLSLSPPTYTSNIRRSSSKLLRHPPTHPHPHGPGDCAKAEVDRAAATRRAEMAERRLASLDTECQGVKERAASLEARERDARQNAQAAAAELIKVRVVGFLRRGGGG